MKLSVKAENRTLINKSIQKPSFLPFFLISNQPGLLEEIPARAVQPPPSCFCYEGSSEERWLSCRETQNRQTQHGPRQEPDSSVRSDIQTGCRCSPSDCYTTLKLSPGTLDLGADAVLRFPDTNTRGWTVFAHISDQTSTSENSWSCLKRSWIWIRISSSAHWSQIPVNKQTLAAGVRVCVCSHCCFVSLHPYLPLFATMRLFIFIYSKYLGNFCFFLLFPIWCTFLSSTLEDFWSEFVCSFYYSLFLFLIIFWFDLYFLWLLFVVSFWSFLQSILFCFKPRLGHFPFLSLTSVTSYKEI